MGINNRAVDKPEEAAKAFQPSEGSTGFENVKNTIADKLRKVAEALDEKAAEQDEQSGMARYATQASEWLEQSVEYVRQFDYAKESDRVRKHIGRNPGRSLLIAGAFGLIIGAFLRRR